MQNTGREHIITLFTLNSFINDSYCEGAFWLRGEDKRDGLFLRALFLF